MKSLLNTSENENSDNKESINEVKYELIKSKDSAWDSEINIIRSVKVIIPVKLLVICNHISRMVDDNEFSIVTDIIKNETKLIDELRLSEEYYIPKQKVSSGSIDYEPDNYNYSVVIHRHPDGLNNFSSTDQNYINQNFELSLLFTQKEGFVNGIYNMKVEESIVPLPVKPIIDYGIGMIDISNIESKNIFDKDFDIKQEQRRDYRNKKDNFKSSYIDEDDVMWEVMELRGRIDLIEEMILSQTGIPG